MSDTIMALAHAVGVGIDHTVAVPPPTWVADIPGVTDPTTQAATKPADYYECGRCAGSGEVEMWVDPFGNTEFVPCRECAGIGSFAEPVVHTIQAFGDDGACGVQCTCGWRRRGCFKNRSMAVEFGHAHLRSHQ